MRRIMLALAASATFAAPAHAVTVFSDGFETETVSSSQTNYAGFQKWDVTGGTVDLIRQPAFGIDCASGSFCVDLDGSTGDPGVLTTKEIFAFNAGDVISVSFDASGSQRSGNDSLVVGLQLVDPVDFTLDLGTLTLAYDDTFDSYVIAPFAFNEGGAFKLVFRADPDTRGSDNVGIILDNVSLDIAAVPEPASWAMMIAGFGLIGGAMRTRRREGPAFA